MADYWQLNGQAAPGGTKHWDFWTTIADLATVNTAGQVTTAPYPALKKGDVVYAHTGCSAVSTPTERAAWTAKALCIATADATSAGAVDLSDGTALQTDSD